MKDTLSFLKKADFKKTVSILLLFLGFSMLIVWGCRKVTNEEIPIYSIEQAKEWYYRHFRKTPIYKDSKIKRFPDWQNGVLQEMGDFQLMEYPLRSSQRTTPVTNASYSEADKKRIAQATFERMLIGRNSNGIMQARVLSYIPDLTYLKKNNYDISQNLITKLDTDFEGLILIHKWDGSFVNGYRLKNGKPVSKIEYREKNKNTATIKSNSTTTPGIITTEASPGKPANSSNKDNNISDNAWCEITWYDYYRTYSSGHMEGDKYIEDDYYEVYLGSGDFEFSAGCYEEEIPFDPCKFFDCYEDEPGVPPAGFTQVTACNTGNATIELLQIQPQSSTPSLGNDWGLTWPESVEITITACNDGTKWNAIITKIVGQYSQQVRLLPGVTEVTGPGVQGNTTSSNYCTQVYDLNTLGKQIVLWYMLQAVQKHEDVHLSRFLGALTKTAATLKPAIEALSVPNHGQDEATAITELKALSTYIQLSGNNATQNWFNTTATAISLDHNPGGATDIAEAAVVNPMISTICSYRRSHSWTLCTNHSICF